MPQEKQDIRGPELQDFSQPDALAALVLSGNLQSLKWSRKDFTNALIAVSLLLGSCNPVVKNVIDTLTPTPEAGTATFTPTATVEAGPPVLSQAEMNGIVEKVSANLGDYQLVSDGSLGYQVLTPEGSVINNLVLKNYGKFEVKFPSGQIQVISPETVFLYQGGSTSELHAAVYRVDASTGAVHKIRVEETYFQEDYIRLTLAEIDDGLYEDWMMMGFEESLASQGSLEGYFKDTDPSIPFKIVTYRDRFNGSQDLDNDGVADIWGSNDYAPANMTWGAAKENPYSWGKLPIKYFPFFVNLIGSNDIVLFPVIKHNSGNESPFSLFPIAINKLEITSGPNRFLKMILTFSPMTNNEGKPIRYFLVPSLSYTSDTNRDPNSLLRTDTWKLFVEGVNPAEEQARREILEDPDHEGSGRHIWPSDMFQAYLE